METVYVQKTWPHQIIQLNQIKIKIASVNMTFVHYRTKLSVYNI